ncbi:MAG: exo-alpha-sialidase [Gammaproteobacteria bacterium]|nr:exo-alpha-sialidase [Gammaproteobacteria bacterium]
MADTTLRIATRKGLFSARQSDDWRLTAPSFLGDNCSAVLRHPVSNAIYVALDHGHFGVKLHRSRDEGETFEEIPVPTYPPKDDNEEPWVDIMGRTIPDSLQLIWCLEAGHPDQGERLWAGTIPGGLFRSDDGGDSWQLSTALWNDPSRRKWFGGGMDFPGIHSILIHPDKPNDITIAVSCGGVWHSGDDGESWSNIGEGMIAPYTPPEQAEDPGIQDVHRLARCRAEPDQMWLQHHAGIYLSGDGGRHWKQIKKVQPSSFGFAAVAHPTRPDTAWFVPEIKDEHRIPVDGKVVVNRTDDGGRSFASFSEGLPGPMAYDLVFRHALETDSGGDLLAMGSTTGSLWISENGGESWRTVSNHLPPVYALRFD